MRSSRLAFILLFAVWAIGATSLRYGPRCVLLLPSGDSATGTWTAFGGGTFFSEVDEAGLADCSNNGIGDSDTSYINCAAGGNCTIVYDLPNDAAYTGANTQIRYVAGFITCRKTTSGASATINLKMRISGVDYNLISSSTNCPFNAGVYTANSGSTRYYTNPNTGGLWTSADVDALQLVGVTTTTAGDRRITNMGLQVAYEKAYGTVQAPRLRSGGN